MPQDRDPMSEIVRQAAHVQHKVEQVRKEIRDREVSASSAGDSVQVTVTCEGKVKRIHVSPEFFETEGLDMTLDVIAATINRAMELADKLVEEEVVKATGGLHIPGITT